MSVLARDELHARLSSEDPELQIFRPRSWEPGRVRGASYELRVGSDYLILPDGTRFWPEASDPDYRSRSASFDLEPGQVAFVSTAEKLWMPWDLTGNIAPKFRLALEGLLVMGGMLVDPGYGRLREAGDKWVPRKEGERLHFQLANIGTKTLNIVPEETSVAAIQFVALAGDSRRERDGGEHLSIEDLDVPCSDKLLRELFHAHAQEPLEQLAFFSNMSSLQKQTEDLDVRVKTNETVIDASTRATEVLVEASEKAIDRIIIFGYYLVLITIVGVAFAAILNALIR
ncbi:MAG: dCTP deaminase domain-containing protein [Solirubrobacterales bacterium]